jgi:hypothetical protein
VQPKLTYWTTTGEFPSIEGDIQDFLGVNIDRKDDGSIHLTQPHLIDQILEPSVNAAPLASQENHVA